MLHFSASPTHFCNLFFPSFFARSFFSTCQNSLVWHSKARGLASLINSRASAIVHSKSPQLYARSISLMTFHKTLNKTYIIFYIQFYSRVLFKQRQIVRTKRRLSLLLAVWQFCNKISCDCYCRQSVCLVSNIGKYALPCQRAVLFDQN